MRKAAETDFPVTVEGVGDFAFSRRTLGDALKIRSHYLRLTGGEDGESDPEISMFASVAATIKVLCVSAPDGWEDVETLDLTAEEGVLEKLLEVFDGLKVIEDSFRKRKVSASTT